MHCVAPPTQSLTLYKAQGNLSFQSFFWGPGHQTDFAWLCRVWVGHGQRAGKVISGWSTTCSYPGISLFGTFLHINLSKLVHKGYYCELPSHTDNKCGHKWKHLRSWRSKSAIRVCGVCARCCVLEWAKETKTEGASREHVPQGLIPCYLSGVIYLWHAGTWMLVQSVYRRVEKRSALH